MGVAMSIQLGSPRFRLWLTDAWPIVRGGLFVAAAAFVGSVGAPLIGVTVDHFPLLDVLAGLAGAGLVALQQFLSDNSKG